MSDEDKKGFATVIDKYEGLETRQRFIALGLVAVVLLVIFDLFWFAPQEKKTKSLQRQIDVLENERSELTEKSTALQNALADDGTGTKRRELDNLKKSVSDLDKQLSNYAQLVTPRQMPEVLRNFFNSSAKLKLIRLKKLAVEDAFVSSDPESATSNSFFKHPFEVELKGQYFDLLDALKQLENMNIKIYWQNLEYQVEQHPQAKIKMVIYTYSYDRDWIGA
ncbi:hypothetical protein [Pleionea sp. CnH1-48]|uniref:hypothetical protein n=1 Tax=Pleionea sp. CnH1-48 TaxID=2954494 RepID=UPI002096A687|nr:hypothetical protein [Pleionea sp. CnH1-48]MCO7226313.1 hypothetical protein [Pleionea sp. CnH1-48]